MFGLGGGATTATAANTTAAASTAATRGRRGGWRAVLSPRTPRGQAALAAVVGLLLLVAYYHAGTVERRRDTMETVRLLYDRLTCDAVVRDTADGAGVAAPGALLPLDCRGRRDRSLRQPRVYVAWRETEAALAASLPCQACGEADWRDWLLANTTEALVARPEEADVVWIPFPGTCHCAGARPPRFEEAWQAVRHLGPGRFATLCTRPWMERTNFAMESRDFLRRYPRVSLFSPELKNVRSGEMEHAPAGFRRHVVVPQWPPDFEVHQVAQGKAALQPRRYMFCFEGTQLNGQRTATALALGQRTDSFVRATCRRDRNNLNAVLNTYSPAELYSQCEFCPLPKGDSLSDRRFFDAMRTGCIPVLFERLRPLPFVYWLDYFTWALLQTAHDVPSLTSAFDRLAAMSPRRRADLRAAMMDTAVQISFDACQDRAGLWYAMASLVDLPPAHKMDDLWGYQFEVG